MLEGKDIVCVAPSFWRSDSPLNVHHIMGRLAPRNRILFIESTGLRAPKASGADLKKVLKRVKSLVGGVRRVPEGLHLLPPKVLPFHGNAQVRRLNDRLLREDVKRVVKRLGMKDPILWVFLPTGASLAGCLDEALLIYHCVDAYEENPGVDREAILGLETKLLSRCDLFFATSRALYEDKRPAKAAAHYFPNVADADHFSREAPAAAELSALPRPRLGYVGNLADYKVDLELLMDVARARPDWSYCFVGPVGAGDPGTRSGDLAALSNVHFLGPRPYAELPAYLAGFDLCLIPFRLNASTRSSFPLKFYEYMAAGREILSTPLEALAEYRGKDELCRFASDAPAFLSEVEAALAREQSPALRELRREEARRHSWPQRMEEISAAVQEGLVRKAGGGRS